MKRKLFTFFLILTVTLTFAKQNILAAESNLGEKKSCSQLYDESARRIIDVLLHPKDGSTLECIEFFLMFAFIPIVYPVAFLGLLSAPITYPLINHRLVVDKHIRKALAQAYEMKGGDMIKPVLTEDDEKFYRYGHSYNSYISPQDRPRLDEIDQKKKILKDQIPFNELYIKLNLDQIISKKDFAQFLVLKDKEGLLCKKYSRAKQRISGFHFIKRSALKSLLISNLQ